MPLGKRRDGTTVGPSSAQRAKKAREVGARPLRRVIVAGEGWGVDAGRSKYIDVDVLECGHVLTGAKDLVGRRWPERRRCFMCAAGRTPDLSPDQLARIAAEAGPLKQDDGERAGVCGG